MGKAVGSTKHILLWLCISFGCGGHADQDSSCAELCEIHQGCGYEVSTCTERCETTLLDYTCEAERRALLRCVEDLPRQDVECDEAGPYSSFRPRSTSGGPCHEQHVALAECDCESDSFVECL